MASAEPGKRRGRSKLFKCFKPRWNDETPAGGFTAVPSCSDGEVSRRRRLHRSVFCAVKTVISKTPLIKRTGNKKNRQELHRSKSESSPRYETVVKKNNSSRKGLSEPDEHDFVIRTNSQSTNNSSLFSSNSSNSTASSAFSSRASSFSNLRSSSERVKRLSSLDLKENVVKTKHPMKKRDFQSHQSTFLSMFVVCLVALVLGKSFAILTCTSAWLYFAPTRRNPAVDSPEDAVDWAEYKKKVVMDGFLERNRSRVLQPSSS